MRLFPLLFVFLLGHISSLTAQRSEINLNQDWKFSLSDDSLAANFSFDDSEWNTVSVPHDWAFEKGISRDGAQAANGGYFDGGMGWYRRNIEMPTEWQGKRIYIEFDGVYMNSEVWLNGKYLGKRPYGYISFRYEISALLNKGKNTLAIRVDNSLEPSARWYHPCGIYAPVKLVVTSDQFITPNGVYVTTPQVEPSLSVVAIETNLAHNLKRNPKSILETIITDKEGKVIVQKKQSVDWKKGKNTTTKTTLELPDPKLWSPDQPYLYTVTSRLISKKKCLDEVQTRLGVRSIAWDTKTGFSLNGKMTKLLGVSEHYEGGPVGGAYTKPLLRWKLQLLKDMGVNAIRTAHNPAPPMFYDLCDEMGFLVMDEIFDGWKKKAPEDYGKQAFDEWWKADMTEWLTRNRNHPSIIVWSVGNETKGDIAQDLVDLCHELDPTKPVTSGHSSSEAMDVFGVNGGSEKRSFFTKPRPSKPFVSTEAPHTWQTRGYYRTKTWYRDGYNEAIAFETPDLTSKEVFQYEWSAQDQWKNAKQHFNSSYDNATVRINARQNWELMRDLDWFSGHFRWTGFDYYGEAGYVHGGWPFRLFMGGALDAGGFEKDLFYFYQSQWTDTPMTHILPHWTHPTLEPGTEIPVWVYSNCEEVELFLNGKSLGKDQPGTAWNEMQCDWMVPWEPGELVAKGYINGQLVSETRQVSASAPADISLSIDEIEVAAEEPITKIVTSAITDANGTIYPYGENKFYYYLSDNVKLISLENGDPVDTVRNVNVNYRKGFMGLNRAFIEILNSDQNASITVGAILGEKQLLTSNKVAIAVKRLTLNGLTTANPNYQAYYTLDGSTPSKKSIKYAGAFDVTLGTTVRASVFSEDKLILSMEERFDKDLGLYWGSDEPTELQVQRGMPAKDAQFTGASPKSFKQSSYLDFGGQEGSIEWYQENDGSAGTFNLTFVYASADLQSARPMQLYVNSKLVEILNFPSSGSWNAKWKEVTTRQSLNAGANYIEIKTTGKSSANIKALVVEPAETN